MGVFNRKGTVRDGLVLELDAANQKSSGGNGNTWKDTTSQGNDGTLTNGPVSSQGPFPGAGYVTFDGTGDYLNTTYTTSNFRWWDTDYTIETWIYPSSLNTGGWYSGGTPGSTLVGNGQVSGGANNWSFGPYNSSGNIKFYYYNGSGQHGMVSTETVNLNEWNHIAFIKNSSGCKIFVNGVGTNYMAISGTPQDNTGYDFFIGRWNSTNITGYVSNLRVVKGTALYTSNFTPQLSELTAVPNTKLLTCQKGTITDASVSGHSITANGNAAAVYNDVSYFDLDGSNDYVNAGSNSDFAFGTGDFTIEMWWYSDQTQSAVTGLLSLTNSSASTNWQLGPGYQSDSNQIVFTGSDHQSSPQIKDPTNYSNQVWTNTIVTRTSGTVKLYTNGANVASISDSSNYSDTGPLKIGINRGNTVYWNGRISVVRLYKGKGLTASEVAQNFNALRGRYGI